ncbi:Bifunctional NAD(P)H-hydrate repair enzyme Nnr [invertebrate metagenome]|uniref:Nicotinamide nucleotide repair protein n=1 Tax=invertebrate metagenome TaxID=1711999 RepID=A0A2H9T613_9ZZZZ
MEGTGKNEYSGNTHNRMPTALFTAEQSQRLDHLAIKSGIDGFTLMRRAGTFAFQQLCRKWPELLAQNAHIQCFCGAGNNGGDGYIVAALAKQQGLTVSVVYLKDPATLKNEAAQAYAFCCKQNVAIHPFDETTPITGDILVDAMLGTGLTGPVRGNYQTAIHAINGAQRPVLAIDIPSGLSADTGAVLGCAIAATATITFIGIKQGLLTGAGTEQTGQLFFDDLSIPDTIYQQVTENSTRLGDAAMAKRIHPRVRNSHKGTYGTAVLMGGNHGMAGAIIMAAEAAMACGTGKVYAATRPEHLIALLARRPEVMTIPISQDFDQLSSVVQQASALVIGPGLGMDKWAKRLLQFAINQPQPLIMDADALNLLSENPDGLLQRSAPTVVTPHPGEADRLLNVSTSTIQKNRFHAVTSIAQKFKAITVLKGAGSLISDGQHTWLCSAGNPGMAVAGMGDILSGVIGSLLAQGFSAIDAACLGVWLHSTAADHLSQQQGEIGMMATELIPLIRQQLNTMSSDY